MAQDSWEDEWDEVEPIPVPTPPVNKPSETVPRGPTVIETGSGRTEYVPQVRLLKRDTKVKGGTQMERSPSGGSSKSLAEREAEYAAARARIFGEGSDSQTRAEPKEYLGESKGGADEKGEKNPAREDKFGTQGPPDLSRSQDSFRRFPSETSKAIPRNSSTHTSNRTPAPRSHQQKESGESLTPPLVLTPNSLRSVKTPAGPPPDNVKGFIGIRDTQK
ncbi:hypothetical protein SpCBS45565_g01233 [Spizellomyces sp. 'palustris']|nr:hypothetical protein SpCBS45565_g01233 [Spizellomyces sp. 'palustris']